MCCSAGVCIVFFANASCRTYITGFARSCVCEPPSSRSDTTRSCPTWTLETTIQLSISRAVHLLIWPHPCFVLLDLARSHECVCFDACCDRETYQVAGFGPTFVFFYDFWSFSSGQGLTGINMSHPCVNMISLSTFTHEIIFRGFKAPTY